MKIFFFNFASKYLFHSLMQKNHLSFFSNNLDFSFLYNNRYFFDLFTSAVATVLYFSASVLYFTDNLSKYDQRNIEFI